MASYAITDIHGCLNTFKALLEKINFQKTDTLYLLGDLVDRGPQSIALIDHVMDMQANGYDVQVIQGNHEWMFLEAINETIPYCWDWRRYQHWIKNGGITVMMNLGYKRIDDLKGIDKKYDTFLRNLLTHVVLDKYILVHAGLNFKEEDIFKDKTAMHSLRNWYESIDKAKLGDKIIVHGHSPRNYATLEDDIKEMKYPAINIDCGCVYDPHTKHGRLCALNLDTMTPVFQENVDKVPQPETAETK